MRPPLERPLFSSRVTLFGLVVLGLAPGCAGSAVGGGGGAKDMAMSIGDDAGMGSDMGDGSGDMAGAHPVGPDMANNCAPLTSQPVRIASDITTDTSLTCDKLYTIAGTVMVTNNATLTIAPGTTVLMASDGSLAITPGAKLMAVGTRDLPIVFTSAQLPGSRKAGDWGALVLVGNAPGNWGTDGSGNVISTGARADANGWPTADNIDKFPIPTGTSGDPNDSSGQLKYVRLEYGGFVTNQYGSRDHEMLALYGVGRGTTLEYIDMRQANFECLFSEGGMFYAKHLVCQWSGNGGFGFSRGNQSHAQFLFDQESPKKEAEGIGIKGPSPPNLLAPRTDPLIYNATMCGTHGGNPTFKDPWSLFLVRNPAGKVYNFIGTGFNAGMASVRGIGSGNTTTELHSSIFFDNHDAALGDMGVSNIYDSLLAQDMPDPTGWFYTTGWKNSENDPQLDNCFDATRMGGKPAAALTTNAATPPDDGFFDPKAGYIGAFKDRTDQWATGNWVVWDSK